MKSIVLITHDEVEISDDEDHTQKEEQLEEALDEVLNGQDFGPITTQSISVSLGAQHEDWEEGEPCPECGSTTVSVMELDEGRYISEDGDFEFMKKGDATGPSLSYVCGECVTHLKSFSLPV